MSFDFLGLTAAIRDHTRVARVVVAGVAGSVPREVGAAMLVWATGQSGTIGGGALEFEAAGAARAMLAGGGRKVSRVPLGPALGQCCGGAVTLVTEVFEADCLPRATFGVFARAVEGATPAPPLAVARVLDRARSQGALPAPHLVQGWFIEPVAASGRSLWVWGAGHVGRALVGVLAPIPGLAITWVDVAQARFPSLIPEGVTALPAADAAALVPHAPKHAEHLILTYSHALDLDLCHRLLTHGFARCGLIGSATKWTRFRSRLGALGHSTSAIARIDCPIGDPALGKHPQAIAVGVAGSVLRNTRARQGKRGAL